MTDVRKLLKTLAERALRTPQEVPDAPGERPDRLSDALLALRVLVENWDDLMLGQPSLAGGMTPRGGTPHPAMRATPLGPPFGTPRLGSPRSSNRRPEEARLLSLLAEHRVSLRRAGDVDALLFPCRSCGEPFEAREDVLVVLREGGAEPPRPYAATHLRCRWWWWENPHSPIRPKG